MKVIWFLILWYRHYCLVADIQELVYFTKKCDDQKVIFYKNKNVTSVKTAVVQTLVMRVMCTLVYQIEVQARLLVPTCTVGLMHGLILVCTFINFEEISLLHICDLKNNSNISLELLVFGVN